MATVFEPIMPVPPITTIFMVYSPLSVADAHHRFDTPREETQGSFLGRPAESQERKLLGRRAPLGAPTVAIEACRIKFGGMGIPLRLATEDPRSSQCV